MKNAFTALTMILALTTSGLAFADGGALFNKKCATCHGKDGKGKTDMGEELKIPDLSDAKFQATFTDADALKQLQTGTVDKETKKERMPSFKDKYSEAEMKELVAHVRTLKGQ